MKLTFRNPRCVTSLVALSLLAVPPAAEAAPARTGKAHAAARRPAAQPSKRIIALPLAPVVSAAQRLCEARTPSGLGYTVLRAGAGAKPGAGDTVLINYIGYLTVTGAVFDQGMRSPLPVDQVIPGFSQGLQMMAKGGILRLCIPAAMGYGARASGPIPANSDLVFQVELVDFRTAEALEAMRREQAAEQETPEDAGAQQ